MQSATADLPISMPNGAAKAYDTVLRRTERPRDIEYLVFEQVTAALQNAQAPQAHFTARIQAAHRNRELWQTLAFDVASEDNGLPVDLRVRLASLSIWVTRQTERVINDDAPVDDLIEVNRSIMQGLKPTVLQAA